MQLPINLNAVIDEATNINEARSTPISVSIFIDESAPADLQVLIQQSFSSSSLHAKVNASYFPTMPLDISQADDMAVIIAGLDHNISRYAASIREAGVPVMVVTTLPRLVKDIARASGLALLDADIISPTKFGSSKALEAKTKAQKMLVEQEPIALGNETTESLLENMGEWILETCKEKRLAFALAFSFMRKPLSLETVNATALQNAGVGLVVFIPGADMPIMTLNQAKMLLKIAAAYGQPLNIERVKELGVIVGGGFALRSVARQAVAFVPALGWAIKAGIGYTGTVAMGRAAIEYFESGGNLQGLAGVAVKARDKVVEAAAAVSQQKNPKEALKNFGVHAGSTISRAAKRAVPFVASTADSAMSTVVDSGIVSPDTAKKANVIKDLIVNRKQKGKN